MDTLNNIKYPLILIMFAFAIWMNTTINVEVKPLPDALKTDETRVHTKKTIIEQKVFHIAITSCGNQLFRLEEAFVTLKSALLFLRKEQLQIHIFSTNDSQAYLKSRFAEIPEDIRLKVNLTFYAPYFPDKIWVKLFALCSTQRLFIADKIREAKEILYMDSDSMLLSPLEDVWKEFNNFTPKQMVGMTYNSIAQRGWYSKHPIPHPPPYGVNAGVLLMDLEKVRDAQWTKNLTSIMNRQKSQKINILGDQDILNEYFYHNPERLYIMKCDKNFRTDYCKEKHLPNISQSCLSAEKTGVSIVHASRKVAHKPKSVFNALYESIKNYDFTIGLQRGFIEPFKKKLSKLDSKTICANSKHLFLNNLLSFVNTSDRDKS